MKIGVVTYWYGNDNYGMILQCWALQTKLKQLGHDPFVIRFKKKEPALRRFVKQAISKVKCLVNSAYKKASDEMETVKAYNAEKDKLRGFEQFRRNHICFSHYYYEHLSELRKNAPDADCYICGSDQIWSCHLKIRDSWAYYLAFGESSIRRIAYAPSFGKKQYPSAMMGRLASALAIFDYLSCREYDGVEICKQAGYKAEKVEDPTLLLNPTDYFELCAPVAVKGHAFIYSVNMRSAKDIYWNELKQILNSYTVVSTPSGGSFPGKELFGSDVDYIYATPGEWLSLIKKSSIVITSSFHGIVFSILFNKKFAFVPLKGTYAVSNNRMFDLLDGVGLRCLVVNKPEDYQRILGTEIDWDIVNLNRTQLIKSSELFLLNSLS